MDEEKYIVLLNDALKAYILALNSDEKRRLREKFEFLENGIWDTGVRVKKLKGISEKVIFEARLSKSERIIFTLGKHDTKTAIYIWGIVKHDDVTAAANNILPYNVPFLNFEPETREEFPDIIIDDLEGHYFSQEDIEEKSSDDYGPQKWLVLTDEEWNRLLLSADPDNFEIFLFLTSEQQNVLKTSPPVLLSGTAGSGKTTISVYYLLRKEFEDKDRIFLTYSPYLKRFSERIYNGLVKNTEYESELKKPDFYVFRDILMDIMTTNKRKYDLKEEVGLKEFDTIFRNHSLYKKYDKELVWEEIRSIIKGAKPPISVNRYKKLISGYHSGELTRSNLHELEDYLLGLKNYEFIQKIERVTCNKCRYSTYDDFILDLVSENNNTPGEVSFILQEILKIIEKKANNFSAALLTFQEYNLLGKKRAPNFLYDRKEIYSIAEYYQSRLEEQGLWDEIDLCKSAIQLLNTSKDRFLYDLVVCDEVQDFSDIQLSLIFRLAKSCRGIFLAGDLKQVINPSGFRWEEVKKKFYERAVQVPEVFNLNLNFRSVGNIVKLSNALLDLKQGLIGLSSGELREEWKFNGKPGVLIYGIKEEEMVNKIKITGAGQIILVRTAHEKNKLKKALGTELIFTINEAKGLEFDTVFFWKFCHDKKTAGIWRKIKNEAHFEQSHYPHIKHELNLLYVAITRARNTLIIYDGVKSSEVWDIETFRDKLYRTEEKEALSEIWQKVSSPSEWEEQGAYFYEREYYSAAVECYRNSGNIEKTEIAEAFLYAGKKNYGKAAQFFEKYGYRKKAAQNYELNRDYEKALKLWELLKDREHGRLCMIKLYEKKGNYNKAAEEWEKLKNYENALKNWERAENHEKIAGFYLSKKQHKEAASSFEKAGDFETAASCYKKIKKYDKAAALYFKCRDYKNAVSLYKKLKNNARIIQCYENLKDYYSVGLLYEKNKDIDNAIEAFREFAGVSQENRNMLEQEALKYYTVRRLLKSAVRYSAISIYEKSASIFFEKGYCDQAIREYTILNDHLKLSACYKKKKNYYESALELEKTDIENKWDIVTEALISYLYTARKYDKKRADNLFREAENCYQSGSYEKALSRYKAIRYPEKIFDVYMKINKDEQALEYFIKDEMYEYARRYFHEKEDVDVSLDFLNHLSKVVLHGYDWGFEDYFDVLDVFTQLLLMHLKKHSDEETLSIIDNFISSLDVYYFRFDEEMPDSLFDLLFLSKNYNVIFKMIRYRRIGARQLPERISTFLDSLKDAAEEWDDANLFACYFFIYDRQKYEDILKRLELTDRNYELFTESRLHFHEAVDFLIENNNTKRAVTLCRIHRDNNRAASIYEQQGDLKQAGRYYREAKNYPDAIRCYTKTNDERGMARVYERLNEYPKAIDIWKKLGNTREIKRLQKKINKKNALKEQFDLF